MPRFPISVSRTVSIPLIARYLTRTEAVRARMYRSSVGTVGLLVVDLPVVSCESTGWWKHSRSNGGTVSPTGGAVGLLVAQ